MVAAQATNTDQADRQNLAASVADAVLAAWSRISWAVADEVEASNDWQMNMSPQTRASAAASTARDVTARFDTRQIAEAAVTAELGQLVRNAAGARGRGAVPTLAELRDDIALAATAAAAAVLGDSGGVANRKAAPADAADVAVAAMGAVSNTLKAAIGAAVALAPMIPMGPNTHSPR